MWCRIGAGRVPTFHFGDDRMTRSGAGPQPRERPDWDTLDERGHQSEAFRRLASHEVAGGQCAHICIISVPKIQLGFRCLREGVFE
jgi:hypothetical protein